MPAASASAATATGAYGLDDDIWSCTNFRMFCESTGIALGGSLFTEAHNSLHLHLFSRNDFCLVPDALFIAVNPPALKNSVA